MQTSIVHKNTNHEYYLHMIRSYIIYLPAPTKHKSLIKLKSIAFSFNKSASEAILDGIKNIAMCKWKVYELQHCNMRMDKLSIAMI